MVLFIIILLKVIEKTMNVDIIIVVLIIVVLISSDIDKIKLRHSSTRQLEPHCTNVVNNLSKH